MILFLAIFLTVYTSLNYYIFIRGWQVLSSYQYLKPFYIVVFIFVAYSYIAAKIFYKILPPVIHDALIWIGSFWFAFFVYFILSLLVIDIARFIGFQFEIVPQFIRNNYNSVKLITALSVIVIVSVIILLGYINTRNIVVKKFEIDVPNLSVPASEINVVMLADLHLSPINNENFLNGIVNKINNLDADIVLMPGDIVDDKIEVLDRLSIGDSFKNIKSRYGVYASNGNHEFINEVESAVKFMEGKKIRVLRDTAIFIDNSFYIVGRDDKSKNNFSGKARKSLDVILKDVDKSLPVILLDHTPVQLDEAEKNGIDLQVSGHTHNGQFFPGNIITNLIYEVSRGYLKKGNTNYIVTSGVGTWGPPVRNASNSEIVQILIRFKN